MLSSDGETDVKQLFVFVFVGIENHATIIEFLLYRRRFKWFRREAGLLESLQYPLPQASSGPHN